MSAASTYQFRHSVPNRSATARPRSLSLAEYQPLTFDRDRVEAAYQQSLQQPASSTATSIDLSHPSLSSFSGPNSTDTHATSFSTLSHNLKAGDNPHAASTPHLPLAPPTIPGAGYGNFAGVGAGHSLTPPDSPDHRNAQQLHRQSILSPVPGSPLPPTPPQRPMTLPESTFRRDVDVDVDVDVAADRDRAQAQAQDQSMHPGIRRGHSAMDVDGDAALAVESGGTASQSEPFQNNSPRGRGKRRALPDVPTNVPQPEPPTWEPDYKPQIPSDLTAPSVANVYAQLSAPPPNLPPRRTQPFRQASAAARSPSRSRMEGVPVTGNMGLARTAMTRGTYDPAGGQSGAGAGVGTWTGLSETQTQTPGAGPSQSEAASSSRLTNGAGALDVPSVTEEPSSMDGVESQPKPQRSAEKEVHLQAEGKTPIWSTHYLDPCLRNSLVNIPHQVTNVANVALSGLSSGPKTRFNTTTGAPIDGMARMAKDWLIKPDGRFTSEGGAVELALGIIDCGGESWGKDKARKRARVEVATKSGGIKVDIVEIDPDRQLDLKIETKSGDVLVLLPETYHGPLHITSPDKEPVFLDILQPQCQPVAHPYDTFYTTFVTPLSINDPKKSKSIEHTGASKIQKWIPGPLRERSDILDQVIGGYASHTRGEQSKISVQSTKGKVVIGYRETRDEETAKAMGLKVGVLEQQQRKKKHWWSA